ncbi:MULTISPECIES: ROK family transcriptional regulator [Rhizobium]|uniref:ROK family transcriptional regulator n=1 Tax=Rhizobium TaxID=379 RepID=UPI0007EBC0B8|nr:MULTISPECIES: ROK family transcriptional regulator [Rhizobium]ANK95559.1 ROK family transcriptional regulator protein [Rhizobium sp. N6212]ANL01611.1 ROK family transcriptional regulator protein [Rhizobium sp. N621]ANL07739.1 ROK family transcriptional regulator protein [Rhizobium esperanzae]ANL13910.1 ROK family transcriptional regulator protein [Rhizobium sp. N1341]ANL25892.1 ROK family transcriptional regulator protein [Rhizobium sp. N113]
MNQTLGARHSPDLTGANVEDAGAHNRAVVLRCIHREAPISRAEIARQTGFTKPAIARIVDRLLDEGLIMEARRRHGLRGQPAIELEINPDAYYAIGINIDRDHLTILAVDAVGNVRARVHHEKRFILPSEFMQLTSDAISHFQRSRLIDDARLAGIGLAMPDWLGEISLLGKPDAYQEWTDFDVRTALESLTPHPVFTENEANAAALAELNYGLGAESSSFFYIAVNACPGGGLVLDGNGHRGAMGLSGEIGWLPIADGSDGEAQKVQLLGEIFSLFFLYDFLTGHGIKVSVPQDLLMLDARGKRLVSQWLKEMSAHLAVAVKHIAMIVDPDAVLVGGRLPIRIVDELLRYVHEHLDPEDTNLPSLHRASIGEDASAMGAAAMPMAAALMLASADVAQRTRSPLKFMDRLNN